MQTKTKLGPKVKIRQFFRSSSESTFFLVKIEPYFYCFRLIRTKLSKQNYLNQLGIFNWMCISSYSEKKKLIFSFQN